MCSLVFTMQRKAMLGEGPMIAMQLNNSEPQKIEVQVVDARA